MQYTRGDENSHLKLAQIWHVTSPSFQLLQKSCSRNFIINQILKDDFNVNQKLTLNGTVTISPNFESRSKSDIHLKDCTALHFLSHVVQDIDTFTRFIARGADFTLKNRNGQTALHLMITQRRNIQQGLLFGNVVLSAHVKSRNFTNPHDNDGISHFHGACMANHVEAAELFLDNGASIEETVKFGAPQFAGWTPLHFALAFGGFKVAQMLVEHGANVHAMTDKRENPLDLLFGIHATTNYSQNRVADKEQFVRLLLEKGTISAVGFTDLQIACSLKDLAIAERLLDEGADVEYAVPSESPIRPGRTALHFAAYNGVKAVKMLLKRGAKFDLAIFQNETALEPCQVKYSFQELCDILSCIENVKEMRLSDGRTKLLDLISVMESLDMFRRFLQTETVDITAVVPGDSALWPGYTILHLAVTFSKILEFNDTPPQRQYDTAIVEECLVRGMSLNVPNFEKQTPIHLAFSQNKTDIVRLMLKRLRHLNGRISNLVDKNNLSYLHIACTEQEIALPYRLLDASDPNDLRRGTTQSLVHMKAGSTPLHVAVSSGSRAIAELLLRYGADLHATDASGLTPIHRLFEHIFSKQNEIVGCLMNSLLTNVVDRVADGLGLSYLHIASAFGYTEIVDKLLDLGSNVNAVIERQEHVDSSKIANRRRMYLSRYSGFTPLHMSTLNVNPKDELLDLLLRRGADMFASGTYENAQVLRRFFRALWEREDMQKSMEERFGLTKLHVACYLKNEESVKSALTDGADVNVPVHADSVIFAGCTPLHLLVTVNIGENRWNLLDLQIAIGSMVKMLIDRGADVTIANVEKDTPVHVFSKIQILFLDRDRCKNLLLNAHRDFGVNPVNDEGWSHFHLACYWHRVDIVEKFLQHGSVDVNRPLDYFINNMAGSTPLHLALNSPQTESDADWKRLSQTVDLLLGQGTDVAAKDVCGDTPLHTRGALSSPGMSIFEKLASYGGDIICENLQGQTPIEQLVSIRRRNGNSIDYSLAIFKKYGYKFNNWNRLTGEGYIAKTFLVQSCEKLSDSYELKKFLESSNARTVDDVDRTAIHNTVACSRTLFNSRVMYTMLYNYIYAIESFRKIGIDIEHKDKSGQTALHYAVRMENLTGVEALLMCGADVNIVDKDGKSPFCYAMKYPRKRKGLVIFLQPDITTVLRLHVQKLQHLKLEVSHVNQSCAKEIQLTFHISFFEFNDNHVLNLSRNFFRQIEVTKTMDVGTNSLTLYDFLSETAGVNLYSLLWKSERDIVDRFFESIDYKELGELTGIIKLQSYKMKMRLGLIDTAFSSLRVLLGFSVPGLCEQISRFLLNSDLKSLIESTAQKARKRKSSEISS